MDPPLAALPGQQNFNIFPAPRRTTKERPQAPKKLQMRSWAVPRISQYRKNKNMRDPRTRKGIHVSCFGNTFWNTCFWQTYLADLSGKYVWRTFWATLLGTTSGQTFWATLFGKLSGALTGQPFVANCFGKHIWQTYLANLSRLTSLGSPLWLASLRPPLWAKPFGLAFLANPFVLTFLGLTQLETLRKSLEVSGSSF